MANVLHHPIEFHPGPVSHAPSPFGFGFGLGASSSSSAMVASAWPTPGHTNPSAFQQLASVNQQSSLRVQKRRHEVEDDADARDASMDRSPTPERPKRAAPKRARVAPESSRGEGTAKENKSPNTGEDDRDDVDVGMLLASLPPQSLLPLLTSLLNAQPSLKSVILPLIPRPTLETAIQALAQSAKRLREAYPYSTIPSFGQPSPPTTFGFGKPSVAHNISAFGQANHTNNSGGMRDSYILSRLRPYITEFVAACVSYLPYFSCLPAPTASSPSAPTTQSTALQSLHKDKLHPSETFSFLAAVTNHIISQPALTQASLGPLILPRLAEEWKAWIMKVDETVNRQGGMFGSETVRSWERILDEMGDGKGTEVSNMMRNVRDLWVSKVGWLVGRTMQHDMDV
ncbi:Tethering factor for nuclear proteasome STS1 [Hypsizygus marmoreus]|uniref:Tethering factor for nuclear proteasome STS1 n=1 Tax=Hypsizygus marmoreus TaxID=39966 RepID=A0A369K8T3_HYPMA|nr:Tethering factor for nuclear proteasome STS1 [Hypsizygus marmoreus]